MTATPPTDPQALADAFARLERTLEDRTAELQALRSQIAALEGAAASAGRTKAQFLSNVSHELRTPMNGVLGMAELLNDTALTGEQREYVDVLSSSARSLLRVVDDILDYSEIETGRLDLERAPFHLHRCLGDTLRLLAPAARAKGLELVGYVDPALPESVRGDLARLRQVVSNVVAAAIRLTPAGDVTMEFGAGTRDGEGGPVRLHGVVRNAGTGLTAEQQAALVGDLEQGDGSSTRRFGVAGLGLTISQRLLEMMGGRLWLEGAPGQGSAFHFTLVVEAAPGPSSLAETYRAPLFGAHALVAHDHQATRQAVSRTVERCGMRATQAGTGEALRRLRAREPRIDVVLMGLPGGSTDVGVPLGDIREVSPAVPVLLMGSPQDAARCDALPVHAFLATPVPTPSLLAAVAAALGAAGVSSRPVAKRDRFRDVRVLVAEDNPINQQVITLVLEGWGARVTVAPSGREALAALDRHRFDLVLMDVQMPDGDGFETTATIRAREIGRHARVPIVALTAQREDRGRCLAAGMDDYLTKPVVPAELADALERMVSAGSGRA